MGTTVDIGRIVVMVRTSGTDFVYLEPKGLTFPFPKMGYSASLKIDTQAGHGVEWVRLNFGREPDEIIDMNGRG